MIDTAFNSWQRDFLPELKRNTTRFSEGEMPSRNRNDDNENEVLHLLRE